MPYASEAVIAQARSGDTAAFVELARQHEPVLRELAESRPRVASADAIIFGALVEAFTAMPTFAGGPAELERWLTGFVETATRAPTSSRQSCGCALPPSSATTRPPWPRRRCPSAAFPWFRAWARAGGVRAGETRPTAARPPKHD